jgi:hypothetical protein
VLTGPQAPLRATMSVSQAETPNTYPTPTNTRVHTHTVAHAQLHTHLPAWARLGPRSLLPGGSQRTPTTAGSPPGVACQK